MSLFFLNNNNYLAFYPGPVVPPINYIDYKASNKLFE